MVRRWLGEERRAGNSTYSHPSLRHEAVVAASPFVRVERHQSPAYEISRSVEAVIGYLYSTSYASRRLFGDNAGRFEADLRQTLLAIEPDGRFTQRLAVAVVAAWKR